tara:strand:+ start:15386 stop:15748 length:363 start_codon:yes stop_codon:yes gene_type:complete
MKTKILIAVLSIGLFTVSTVNAQEKAKMKMDHSKMEMKHDSTKMDMDHSKMDMKMDHSKMAKVYTCSMHPEVVSDKPGECPKCGMNLIEKKMDMKKMDMKKIEKKKMDTKKEDAHEGHNH